MFVDGVNVYVDITQSISFSRMNKMCQPWLNVLTRLKLLKLYVNEILLVQQVVQTKAKKSQTKNSHIFQETLNNFDVLSNSWQEDKSGEINLQSILIQISIYYQRQKFIMIIEKKLICHPFSYPCICSWQQKVETWLTL